MPHHESAYHVIHKWMNQQYPRTGRCEYCGTTKRKTEYATAIPGRYTRNRADWFEFCRPCHSAFDGYDRQRAAGRANTGTKSPAHREALSKARKGKKIRPHSLEHRQALSRAMKARKNG